MGGPLNYSQLQLDFHIPDPLSEPLSDHVTVFSGRKNCWLEPSLWTLWRGTDDSPCLGANWESVGLTRIRPAWKNGLSFEDGITTYYHRCAISITNCSPRSTRAWTLHQLPASTSPPVLSTNEKWISLSEPAYTLNRFGIQDHLYRDQSLWDPISTNSVCQPSPYSRQALSRWVSKNFTTQTLDSNKRLLSLGKLVKQKAKFQSKISASL